MNDRPRAVLWDMDGVLVLNGEVHLQAWQETLAGYGLSMSAEQFAATFGMNNHNILRRLYGSRLQPAQAHQVAVNKEVAYRRLLQGRVRALPGALQWLAGLAAAGWRQAVASSGPMANIAAVLAGLDAWDYFGAVLSGAQLPQSKPDPAIFLQAAAALGVAPGRAVVVEDAPVGVEAAQRAGMRCIAVASTVDAAALQAADLVVERLDQLPGDAFARLVPQSGG